VATVLLSIAATATPVGLSPGTITFPNQVIDTASLPVAVHLTNNQSVPLKISAIAATGDFQQTNTCPVSPATIPALGTCTITVTFTPTAVGWRTGTLKMTDDASTSPQTVSLTGNALAPVNWTPKTVVFGNQPVNTASSAQAVTITNNQSVALTITGITATADFPTTTTCIPSGSNSGSLGPNSSCSMTVNFAPTTLGYKTATLTINDSASSSPQTVSLSGNSVLPVLLNPITLSWPPPQAVGTTSAIQTVTLTNNEKVALAINSVGTTGDFPPSSDCPLIPRTLAPGASCEIALTFTPTLSGTRTGTLTVSDNASTSPQIVSLIGNYSSVYVAVRPEAACVGISQQEQFAAMVSGTPNTAVTWTVDGVLGGNSSVGMVDDTGLYTAPATQGAHTLKAISMAAPGNSQSVPVNVISQISPSVTPQTATVLNGFSQQFQATMCGASNPGVTWSVDNMVGGSSISGTVSATGTYTAPASGGIGKHTLKAVSVQDNARSASAIVTVASGAIVDFGSRTDISRPIPADIMGVERADSLPDQSNIAQLISAGFRHTRTYARLTDIFATPTPNWNKLDPYMAMLQQAGLKPLLQVSFTPSWLQPNPSPCSVATDDIPSDLNTWGQLAAQIVQHMDQKFPGFVQDYEIWNEPDLNLCSQNRLNSYLALYAAAAPQMKAQAQADGFNIRVGGPAMGDTSLISTWIPSFLSNSGTARYVDFVSYHHYFGGPQAIQLGMLWDDDSPTQSLYSRTQATSSGASAVYQNIAKLVAAGSQPSAVSTPIYVDEFNTNWAFMLDCCRNNITYGPLWNALFVTDVLNSIYAGAHNVPAKLTYFAATAKPYFCLLGMVDANMDCLYPSSALWSPYPQYYAFDLLASPSFLGLSTGAYMATSVSPPTTQSGLAVTGWYNSTADVVLIVNSTSISYSQLNITVQNVGFVNPNATLYLLNSANPQISALPLALNSASGEYSVAVSVPAHSVLAVAIMGP
jgi:glycosyl hydrolase family 39 (putative alpha-L-iduronidase)/centrosomal CEP192-like protein/ASPM-SPD-2-Hydin domain-containing protein